MDEKVEKKSPIKIRKVLRPSTDENYWDCSVCTYRNGAEAFKCAMCDVRKGTSTRKPRLNSQLVAQQVAQQFVTSPPPLKKVLGKRPFKKIRPRLKNVDRSSAQHMAVTVGNITVIITDYKLLKPENSPSVTPDRNSPGPLSEDNTDPGPSLGLEYTSNGVNNQEDSS
ncbi:YY1-associated factor 2 [Desmophyllum pertusum]|uniref:YY1-associated factor 2 n=1 Tax=Desmophyllum pertusum TaxID=174260 RepID=A0A9W9Z7E7_9CNID|nr:YY1-associated factor 2 [Desmophyllum pertusum]